MPSSLSSIPPSIVMVTAPGRVGGLESVVAALATGLAARGWSVRVAAFLGLDPNERCDAFGALASNGVDLVELRHRPRRYGEESRRLAKLIGETRGPVVVHTHGYHADIVGWHAGKGTGSPLVSTVHGYTGGGWKNRLYESISRFAMRRFDAVVAVSELLGKQLVNAGLNPGRVHVIPNAWAVTAQAETRANARRRLGLAGDGPIVGWVGRLSHEKAPDVFVDVVARLPAHIQAVVLGDGAMRRDLEQRAAALGLSNRLRWLGVVPDSARLLPAFDAVALTSRTEGTPMVLLEAMAAGVPVVATPVGGVPAVAPNGEILFASAEEPDAFARAIVSTIGNAESLERAERARRRVEEAYAIEPWVERYEQLYRSLS